MMANKGVCVIASSKSGLPIRSLLSLAWAQHLSTTCCNHSFFVRDLASSIQKLSIDIPAGFLFGKSRVAPARFVA